MKLRPVSTHLGYVAVDEAVLVVHDQVPEVVRGQHLPLSILAQTRLLQQLPAAVEGPLGGRQLWLSVGGATEDRNGGEGNVTIPNCVDGIHDFFFFLIKRKCSCST